jgi:hypothetical protein
MHPDGDDVGEQDDDLPEVLMKALGDMRKR